MHAAAASRNMKKRSIVELARRSAGTGLAKRGAEQKAKRMAWKRDLSLRSNGTIDSWYACFLLDELYDYMVNFTLPWSTYDCFQLNYIY